MILEACSVIVDPVDRCLVAGSAYPMKRLAAARALSASSAAPLHRERHAVAAGGIEPESGSVPRRGERRQGTGGGVRIVDLQDECREAFAERLDGRPVRRRPRAWTSGLGADEA